MIPGISGGAGGVDLSGGPSTAESALDSYTGGAVFNFAPPEAVQRVQAYTNVVPYVVVAVVVLLFVLLKK